MFDNNEKDLPYNLPLEQYIIGAILQDNSCYDKVSELIVANDFYEKTHQKLFTGIQHKLERAYIADLLTLTGFIKENGINYDYVKNLTDTAYISDNIKQYAEILSELSIRRKLILLGKNMITNAKSEKMLVNEQVEKAEQGVFNLNSKPTSNKTIQFFDGAKSVLDFTFHLVSNQDTSSGIYTGFKELDNLLGGFKKGELIILAGRPSMGKTAFSTNICTNIALNAKNPKKVLFVSLEMSYEQICFRIISSLSKVPLNSLLHAKISPKAVNDCLASLEQFKNMPFHLLDTALMTPSALRSILRQLKRQIGIDIVVVDYLQLMEVSRKSESREQEISVISRSLKLIAKEIGIPILALSQMSRDVEKRTSHNEPRLSDLRGSGSIEQDADVILFLFKEDEQIKVSVAKNRNGALGKIPLNYTGEIVTFKEMY